MGLCKCPERKVSTLFCCKHHVNVCESCLVSEHHQCVVRSYLSWLQDQDINSNCALCQRTLIDTDEETLRLVCYDLFHWACLDKYFRSFPSHTAPDGYTCPTCHQCIFPPENLLSPVADEVRKKLSTTTWAKRTILPEQTIATTTTTTIKKPTSIVPTMNTGLSHHPHRIMDTSMPMSTMLTVKPLPFDADDEDKYKRRSVFTWFARLIRSHQSDQRKSQSNAHRTRSKIYVCFIVIFLFISLLTVLYHLTRGDPVRRVDDGQFNPLNNPFIQVHDKTIKHSQ